jgi:hypothetical protein
VTEALQQKQFLQASEVAYRRGGIVSTAREALQQLEPDNSLSLATAWQGRDLNPPEANSPTVAWPGSKTARQRLKSSSEK